MTYADDYLAHLLTAQETAAVRDAYKAYLIRLTDEPQPVRVGLLTREMSATVRELARSLQRGVVPGMDETLDVTWVTSVARFRHTIACQHAAGIVTPVDALCLDLLQWVDDHVGPWRFKRFTRRVRTRLDDDVAGWRQRPDAVPGPPRSREPPRCESCWALRFPADHEFTAVLGRPPATVSRDAWDGALERTLRALAHTLSDTYAALAAAHAPHGPDGLMIEVEWGAIDPRAPTVRATVTAVAEGAVRVGDELTLQRRLTTAPLPGERWLICAEPDPAEGIVTPADGSRRLATP